MAAVRPMLGDLELQQVQEIDTDGDQVFARHRVPVLEGDFLQGLGRRGGRIMVAGVVTGEGIEERLDGLRTSFRDGRPVSFVSDIATATQVGDVLIEELEVRELAGKPQRFEYRLVLREYTEPEPVTTEDPPEIPPPELPETATLIVEVVVEGEPGFDFERVRVSARGTTDGGQSLDRPLTDRSGNFWTAEDFPPGSYTVEATVTDTPQRTGSEPAVVRPGETTTVTITLRSGAVIAEAYVVHFHFDKAFVEPCMRHVLQQAAARARSHPDERLLIVGHTDKAGSDRYNQSLSERRARAVFAALRFGVDEAAAVAEWNEIRRPRSAGTVTTVRDTWDVREYQLMLGDLGYYPGRIDEVHGRRTDTAVRAFRSDHGLPDGTAVEDTVWPVLIRAYLAQDSLGLADDRFLPNTGDGCDAGILAWLGCGEESPLPLPRPPVATAHRPYRRVELLFTRESALPCQVPEPDTLQLPPPTGGPRPWCVGPGSASRHCCFATRDCDRADAGQWCIQPAERGAGFVVSGSMTLDDGSPAAGVRYVLIAADGELMDGEVAVSTATRPAGTGLPGTTDAAGRFSYPDNPKGPGVFTLEIQGDFVVRLAGQSPQAAKGVVVCERLDGSSPFDVVLTPLPPDPSAAGPFAVGELDYPPSGEAASTETIPAITEVQGEASAFDIGASPGDTYVNGAFTIQMRGLVRYPAVRAGAGQDVAPDQATYPLVILAHGNHRSQYSDGTRVENFRGLEYLARHLASHGYIAASIDLDDMNIPIDRFPAIRQRGEAILLHIDFMEGLNAAGSGSPLSGHIDLGTIGLIGHSRGAESVVAAEAINRDESRGRSVRGVVSISPTDFLGLVIDTVPYHVIYGSADNDVSPGWPFYLYDRAAPQKSMSFVYGAIHNRFSAHPDWNGRVDPRAPAGEVPGGIDSADPRALSEALHQDIAKGYCLGFLELNFRRQLGHAPLFNGYRRPDAAGTAEIHQQFQIPGGRRIDDFQQGALDRTAPLPPQLATRATTNSLGETVAGTDLVTPGGFTDPLTEASLQRRDLEHSWHDTVGAMMGWTASTATYTSQLGGLDASGAQTLSFRVTQRFGSARNPDPGGLTPGDPKDFLVVLTDTASVSAAVRVSAITVVPFPYKRSDDPTMTKSALKTVSIPLATFQGVDSALDLTSLQSVSLHFARSATGEIAIDDLELSS